MNLGNREHFPCFYRVADTQGEVCETRKIAWEHEHEVRVFRRNFEFLQARLPLGEFVRAKRQKSRNASYLFAENFFASQF